MAIEKKYLPIFFPNYDEHEEKAVIEVLRSGWIGLGPKTSEFEKKFAHYVGAKYAVGVNSATAALHLSLVAAGVGRGDEVIMPSLTFVSDAHVVLYVGAKPVFADVDAETLCLSLEDVKRKITRSTKAIIPVHYGGQPCDIGGLKRLVKGKGIVIIEDAAHACGATYKGRKIGCISPFTCFSFHAVKNLATGDGGMITTNSKKYADLLRRLRWVGISKDTWKRLEVVGGSSRKPYRVYGWYYEVKELGYKYHMNDISAALGLVQLSKLEQGNRKRRELADRYMKKLGGVGDVSFIEVGKNVVSAQHNFVIKTKHRDELHLYLREYGISSGVHYMPVHLHPMYRKMYPKLRLPITDTVWKQLLTLPLYPKLGYGDQDVVVDCIKRFFGEETKISKAIIVGEKVRLRPIKESDLDSLRIWRNSSRFSFFNSDVISVEGQRKWFEEVYLTKKDDLIFIIETRRGKPVGAVSLYNFEPKRKQAEYGRLVIDKKYRGKGYALGASEALVKFGFDSLGLEFIILGVIPENKPALNLYKKIGFVEVGRDKREIKMELKKSGKK